VRTTERRAGSTATREQRALGDASGSEGGDERVTISVRDDLEPMRVEVETPTRRWVFVIVQQSVRLVCSDDAAD